ncbi:MAG: rhomboid family intramembrane serine protease [Desulfurococcaceae archaeon]
MTVVAGEKIPGRHRPFLTITLIALNVAIYFYTSGGLLVRTLDYYVVNYGFKPVYLLYDASLALKTIFTSMFIHADLFHLFFNMLFLWVFGSRVEKLLGHTKFLLLYVLSGIMAVVFHTSFAPFAGFGALGISAVGASGAISGLLGIYLLLLPRTRLAMCMFFFLIPLCFSLPAYVFIVFWFAQQVIYGYVVLGGVAYFAHVGGFVMGLVLTPLMARSLARRRMYYEDAIIRYMESVLGIVIPRKPGLSGGVKAILAVLLLLTAVGFIYTYYTTLSSGFLVYASTVETVVDSNVQREVVTFYVDDGKLDFSPVVSDNVRILVNRLAGAGVLYNPMLAGENLTITQEYQALVSGLNVPVVLNAIVTYDEHGFVVYSSGELRSKVVVYTRVGAVYTWRPGNVIVIDYELKASRAEMKVLSSLCLISAATALLAIPAVVVSRSLEFYSWTPLGPVI